MWILSSTRWFSSRDSPATRPGDALAQDFPLPLPVREAARKEKAADNDADFVPGTGTLSASCTNARAWSSAGDGNNVPVSSGKLSDGKISPSEPDPEIMEAADPPNKEEDEDREVEELGSEASEDDDMDELWQ